MKLYLIAACMSILLLVYHQVTTWVPLFPWNDVGKYSKKELFLEAGINGVLMSLGCICIFFGSSGFTYWYPIVYYPFLLIGESVDWWIPFFSDHFAKSRKIWNYDSHFSKTLKWIPHKPGKRTPDANHIVLHLISLLTTLVVYLERFG